MFKKTVLTFLFVLFIAAPVYGQQKQAGASSKAPGSSESYKKTEEFLPGEEVRTGTGQVMKVWSTRGPVSVSRAPEPFEDREKTVINPNVGVIVDPRRDGHRVVPVNPSSQGGSPY